MFWLSTRLTSDQWNFSDGRWEQNQCKESIKDLVYTLTPSCHGINIQTARLKVPTMDRGKLLLPNESSLKVAMPKPPQRSWKSAEKDGSVTLNKYLGQEADFLNDD